MDIEIFLQQDIISFLDERTRVKKDADMKTSHEISDLLRQSNIEEKEQEKETLPVPTQIHADKIEIKQNAFDLPPPFPVDEEHEEKIMARVASEAAAQTAKIIEEEKKKEDAEKSEISGISERESKKAQEITQANKIEEEKRSTELANKAAEAAVKKTRSEEHKKQDEERRKAQEERHRQELEVIKKREQEKREKVQQELEAVRKQAKEEKAALAQAQAQTQQIKHQVTEQKAWEQVEDLSRADAERRTREELVRQKIDEAAFQSQEEQEIHAIAATKAKAEEEKKAKAEEQRKAKEEQEKKHQEQIKLRELAKQKRLEEEKKKREGARKKELKKHEEPILKKIYKEEKGLEDAFEKKDYNQAVRHYRRIKRDAPSLHFHSKEQNDLFVQLKNFAQKLPSLQEVKLSGEEPSLSLPKQKDVSNVASKLVMGDFKHLYLNAIKAIREKDKRTALQLLITLAKEHPHNLAVKIHLQEALAL